MLLAGARRGASMFVIATAAPCMGFVVPGAAIAGDLRQRRFDFLHGVEHGLLPGEIGLARLRFGGLERTDDSEQASATGSLANADTEQTRVFVLTNDSVDSVAQQRTPHGPNAREEHEQGT